jgi:hypothetical protein
MHYRRVPEATRSRKLRHRSGKSSHSLPEFLNVGSPQDGAQEGSRRKTALHQCIAFYVRQAKKLSFLMIMENRTRTHGGFLVLQLHTEGLLDLVGVLTGHVELIDQLGEFIGINSR